METQKASEKAQYILENKLIHLKVGEKYTLGYDEDEKYEAQDLADELENMLALEPFGVKKYFDTWKQQHIIEIKCVRSLKNFKKSQIAGALK